MSASRPRTRPSPDERPLLGDRYRLDGVLGRGGMATVHRAHDVLLERDVAVKVFPAVLDGTDDLLRNRAEIRVLATLSHPGLVTLHDAGTVHGDDGSEQVYLVMELVEGPTLAERLRDGAARRRADRAGRPGRRRGARHRARAGHRPPRHQAREHAADQRRRARHHAATG